MPDSVKRRIMLHRTKQSIVNEFKVYANHVKYMFT